jgi:hypothetical protein
MLATAVSVMRADEGLALADATRGAAALVGIITDGRESWRHSRAWKW